MLTVCIDLVECDDAKTLQQLTFFNLMMNVQAGCFPFLKKKKNLLKASATCSRRMMRLVSRHSKGNQEHHQMAMHLLHLVS